MKKQVPAIFWLCALYLLIANCVSCASAGGETAAVKTATSGGSPEHTRSATDLLGEVFADAYNGFAFQVPKGWVVAEHSEAATILRGPKVDELTSEIILGTVSMESAENFSDFMDTHLESLLGRIFGEHRVLQIEDFSAAHGAQGKRLQVQMMLNGKGVPFLFYLLPAATESHTVIMGCSPGVAERFDVLCDEVSKSIRWLETGNAVIRTRRYVVERANFSLNLPEDWSVIHEGEKSLAVRGPTIEGVRPYLQLTVKPFSGNLSDLIDKSYTK